MEPIQIQLDSVREILNSAVSLLKIADGPKTVAHLMETIRINKEEEIKILNKLKSTTH